jgi:hypothetical protein
VQAIQSVVALVPLPQQTLADGERYFVVEKLGLDVTNLGGLEEEIVEE